MKDTTHYCDERLLPGECIMCVGQPPRLLALTTWAGVVRLPVEVLRRTPKRYKVRLLQDSRLFGGVGAGTIRYAPHGSVLHADGTPMEVSR